MNELGGCLGGGLAPGRPSSRPPPPTSIREWGTGEGTEEEGKGAQDALLDVLLPSMHRIGMLGEREACQAMARIDRLRWQHHTPKPRNYRHPVLVDNSNKPA